MLINLSELFTSEGKVKNYTLDIEMKQFQAVSYTHLNCLINQLDFFLIGLNTVERACQ